MEDSEADGGRGRGGEAGALFPGGGRDRRDRDRGDAIGGVIGGRGDAVDLGAGAGSGEGGGSKDGGADNGGRLPGDADNLVGRGDVVGVDLVPLGGRAIDLGADNRLGAGEAGGGGDKDGADDNGGRLPGGADNLAGRGDVVGFDMVRLGGRAIDLGADNVLGAGAGAVAGGRGGGGNGVPGAAAGVQFGLQGPDPEADGALGARVDGARGNGAAAGAGIRGIRGPAHQLIGFAADGGALYGRDNGHGGAVAGVRRARAPPEAPQIDYWKGENRNHHLEQLKGKNINVPRRFRGQGEFVDHKVEELLTEYQNLETTFEDLLYMSSVRVKGKKQNIKRLWNQFDNRVASTENTRAVIRQHGGVAPPLPDKFKPPEGGRK